MGAIGTLSSFSASTLAKSAEVNANFTEIKTKFNTYAVLTDTAATISAIHTFSATPVFAAGITVSASGAAITGDSTITGTLTVSSTINSQTIGAAANLTGSLTVANGLTVTAGTTAVQALTCTNLTASGTISGTIGGGTSFVIQSGSTDLQFKNFAGTRAWLTWTEATKVIKFGNSTDDCDFDFNQGLLATSATSGFIRIPITSGVPTGTAAVGSMVLQIGGVDKLWIRNDSATWVGVALT